MIEKNRATVRSSRQGVRPARSTLSSSAAPGRTPAAIWGSIGGRQALLEVEHRVLDRPPGWRGSARARASYHPVVEARDEFAGIWVSAGGSTYSFDGCRFVCLAVHSAEYRGWIGKTAVDQVRRVGRVGVGLQAMRCKATGTLGSWEPVTLEFATDVVTKRFPPHVPADRLVYGHTERYFRVRLSGWRS